MKRYALMTFTFTVFVLVSGCATTQHTHPELVPPAPPTACETPKQEPPPQIVRFSFNLEPKMPDILSGILMPLLAKSQDTGLQAVTKKYKDSLGLHIFVEGPHPYYEKEAMIPLKYIADNCDSKESCLVPFELGGLHLEFEISFSMADDEDLQKMLRTYKGDLALAKVVLKGVTIKEAKSLEVRKLSADKTAYHGVLVAKFE